jgi:hypothetical protein
MTDAQNTDEFLPTFTDNDVVASAKTNGVVVKLVGRRGIPNVFVVKFATQTIEMGPLVLSASCARTLREVLEQEGF